MESTADISRSSTGWGILPQLTMCTTPGAIRTGSRLVTSKQQKTYPGKSAFCMVPPLFACWLRYEKQGRHTDKPFPFSASAVIRSRFDLTRIAYHDSD